MTFEECETPKEIMPIKLLCEKCGNSVEAEPDVEQDIDAKNMNDFSNDSFESSNKEIIIESVIEVENVDVTELLKNTNQAPIALKKKEICRICNKTGFVNQTERILHESSHISLSEKRQMKQKLTKKEAFFCQICGRHYKTFNSLTEHHKREYDKQKFFDAVSDE